MLPAVLPRRALSGLCAALQQACSASGSRQFASQPAHATEKALPEMPPFNYTPGGALQPRKLAARAARQRVSSGATSHYGCVGG